MPTYEYQCQKCKHKFEEFQLMTDTPLNECPVCKGPVKKLIGFGSGLIFKGSGFYITDYKQKESGSSKNGKRDRSSKDTTVKKEEAGKSSKEEKKDDKKGKN